MQPNQRFALSVHILALLADSAAPMTSEQIADSVATHPVVVRRVMAHLRQHGLVESRPGVSGGWRLTCAPAAIRLGAVYQAVNHTSAEAQHHHPDPNCRVGRRIPAALNNIFLAAALAQSAALNRFTVAGVLADLRAPRPARK